MFRICANNASILNAILYACQRPRIGWVADDPESDDERFEAIA